MRTGLKCTASDRYPARLNYLLCESMEAALMGEHSGSQGRFFYRFDLEKRVPADHLLRKIDAGYCYGIRSERRCVKKSI